MTAPANESAPTVAGGTDAPKAGRWARALALRLIVLLGALIISLLLGEGAFRIVARVRGVNFTLYMQELTNPTGFPAAMQNEHPTLRWTLNPRTQVLATTSDFSVRYAINSKGLRDQEYLYKKSEGKVRIAVLGDSITFGEGIPFGDRFSDIPEKGFSNLEMLNMGVPGYGLDQMMLFFAEEGVKYQPDAVLLILMSTVLYRHNLGATWLNDSPVEQVALDTATSIGPSITIYRQAHDELLTPKSNFLMRTSYLLSYTDYLYTLRQLHARMAEKEKKKWSYALKARGTKTVTPPETSRAYADYLSIALRRLAVLANKLNFKIILANIDPSVSPSLKLAQLPPGTQVFDYGPALEAEAKERTLQFKYDPHYNPRTNRFLGDLLTASLKGSVPGLQPR